MSYSTDRPISTTTNNFDSNEARAKKDLHRAEEESEHFLAVAREKILQPGVAGGLLGVVNVGLLSWAGYALYTDPLLRRDTRFLGTTAAAALVILGAEGYAAEQYAQTPRGRDERRRAKKEGAAIYRQTKEIVLRPGVLGGIVGFVNLGVLGTVGYYSYINWDRPTWDRRIVTAVSAGLLALWGGEGIIAESYKDSRR